MKKGLLGSTALVGAAAVLGGAAQAAEAPEWKLSGNMNFQAYWIDQDYGSVFETTTKLTTDVWLVFSTGSPVGTAQSHDWYFGVDEAELQLDVEGTADNGLKYGFKIEINANTSDGEVADEARIELSGSWGTLQLGDEDGAEDIMNVGGEDIMGATGGFDGEFEAVLYRGGAVKFLTGATFGVATTFLSFNWIAPSYPTIAGDTGDATKISYYSPRFSGFQVGASLTPTPNNGDNFKEDGAWENHYGLGANYDNTFGNLHIQASAVYSAASSNFTFIEDVSAWSVGGIIGWGPFSIGGNYTDNGDSGEPVGSGIESSYWNAAAGFETGPFYFSGGYFEGTKEFGAGTPDSTFTNIALTADYNAAPGLAFYAEVNMIEDELKGGTFLGTPAPDINNDATVFIVGANVSF